MVIVFASVFLLGTLIQLFAYGCLPSPQREYIGVDKSELLNSGSGNNGSSGNEEEEEEEIRRPVTCSLLAADIVDGLKTMWRNPPIRWRILFVGLEVALEDAMVAVVIPEYALSEYDMCKGHDDCVLPLWFGPQSGGSIHPPPLSSSSSTLYHVTNTSSFAPSSSSSSSSSSPSGSFVTADGAPICASIWTALLIACGKLAAVLAAAVFHRCWTSTTQSSGYRPLFVMIFLSSTSTVFFPLSRHLHQSGESEYARIMVFAASFLFFLFSAPPKIGLETLLQGLAADLPGDIQGKIFGVIGTAVTTIDAIVVLAMTLLFGKFKNRCSVTGGNCEESGLTVALWCASGMYVLHGVCELALGPWLMLPPSYRAEEPNVINCRPATPSSVFASYMEEADEEEAAECRHTGRVGGYLQSPISPKS
jgi:hypothetical protein